jgi:multiple sugar transport system permease protein
MAATNRNKIKSNSLLSEQALAYILVTPALLCIMLVAFFPIGRTIYLSLFSMKLQFIHLKKFVGLGNYIILASDPRFWASLYHTLFFVVASVSIEFIIGLGMALVMHRNFKGRGIIRAAILVPWAIPTVVSAMMWSFIYNDQLGVLNDVLLKLGVIDSYKTWLGDASTAMWAAISADVWKTSPYVGLLLLAGLQIIPADLYEAATVDGATKLRQFFVITLPLLKPTILVTLLFRTLDAFRVFDIIFVLTGGGPANSTETISIYTYKTLFRNLDFGIGSAMAVSMFVCVMIISLIYQKGLGARRT